VGAPADPGRLDAHLFRLVDELEIGVVEGHGG
jgi:hypothetical protein